MTGLAAKIGLLALTFGALCVGTALGQGASDPRGAALKAQVPAVFKPAGYTGRISELQNHVVINRVGTIYTVRKSNLLLANYFFGAASDDSSDGGTADTGKYAAVSKKCHYPVAVTLPAATAAAVPDGCRRDLALGKARLIKAGQRVLLADLDFSVGDDKATVVLLEHHKDPNGAETPRFVSQLTLQFPAGFLATANAAQVKAAMKDLIAASDDPIIAQPFLADAPAPAFTLDDNLTAAYSKTSYQLDSQTSGAGKVLNVKASRFLRGNTPGMSMGCVPVVRDGRAKDPGMMCKAKDAVLEKSQANVWLKPEDTLVLGSIKVDSKKDKDIVHLDLIDTTQVSSTMQLNGTTASYHGLVDFEFPKGSLGPDSAGKVSDEIAAVFNVTSAPATGAEAGGGGAGSAAIPAASSEAVAPPAPAAPPQTLEEQLKTIYKLTQVGADASVASRGTVFSVQSGNVLLGTPYSKPAVCPASVVEGSAKPPAAACVAPLKAAIAKHEVTYFAAGQRVNLVSVAVDIPKETVAFGLIDDGSARGAANGAPRFRSAINFVFPKGYLETSDAGQVSDLVNGVLPVMEPGAVAPH